MTPGKRTEPLQDIKSALARLSSYALSTGVPARLIDTDGRVLGAFDRSGESARMDGGLCELCELLGEDEQEDERRAHLYGAYQAERFGGKYIYFCHHSFLFWTAPIMIDGIMRAAFTAGPVLVLDPAEVLDGLTGEGKLFGAEDGRVNAAIANAVRVSTRRATALAELLADEAALLCGVFEATLEINREKDEQQSRIAEYIHDIKDDKEAGQRSYPIAKERELLLMISQGNKAESQRLLNEILGHIFFSSGQEVALIRARVLELVVLLSRAALDGGADIEQIFGLNFTYINQIQHMRSVEDIAYWLSRIMVRFTDLVFTLKDVKHADVIQKALRYINMHYTEKITLDDVAGAVFLSPAYFSKIFNEEMKTSFTGYLNRLRIEKSKTLLRNTDIPLVDLAGLIGYEDQSYFTKVFKKMVGVSPGRYREGRGNTVTTPEIHEDPPAD